MSHSPQRLRVAVVDDEPLAREHLVALLAGEPDVEVIGEAGGGAAAIQLIGSARPDLVLLDVQMPGCDGFGVLAAVAPVHLPLVIFVTAYDAHAIHAFDVAAIDYLLKPVVEPRFRAAVRRAVNHARIHGADRAAQLSALLERLPATAEDRIPIRAGGRVTFVKPHEIDWIDANDDEIRLHAGKITHVVRDTLTAIAAKLPRQFVRIHRSTIVNVERVREIQPWFKGDHVLILEDGTRLTSGRTYQARIRELLR